MGEVISFESGLALCTTAAAVVVLGQGVQVCLCLFTGFPLKVKLGNDQVVPYVFFPLLVTKRGGSSKIDDITGSDSVF